MYECVCGRGRGGGVRGGPLASIIINISFVAEGLGTCYSLGGWLKAWAHARGLWGIKTKTFNFFYY